MIFVNAFLLGSKIKNGFCMCGVNFEKRMKGQFLILIIPFSDNIIV